MGMPVGIILIGGAVLGLVVVVGILVARSMDK